MFKPSLKETHTVTCCGISRNFEWKYKCLVWLLAHIRRKHKKLIPVIEKRARKSALSENGRGYYDGSGTSKTGGWHGAGKCFRERWRETAIERILADLKP